MLGLFDTANFDGHLKTLENLYHEFVLTRGDFDERIFLNNQADQQIGTPVKGIIGLYFLFSRKCHDKTYKSLNTVSTSNKIPLVDI